MSPPDDHQTEELIPAVNPVSGSNLPREQVREAMAALLEEGFAVTYAEAWHLVKRWRDQDAHAATIVEFKAWLRRGDILRIRQKIKRPWAVTSG